EAVVVDQNPNAGVCPQQHDLQAAPEQVLRDAKGLLDGAVKNGLTNVGSPAQKLPARPVDDLYVHPRRASTLPLEGFGVLRDSLRRRDVDRDLFEEVVEIHRRMGSVRQGRSLRFAHVPPPSARRTCWRNSSGGRTPWRSR